MPIDRRSLAAFLGIPIALESSSRLQSPRNGVEAGRQVCPRARRLSHAICWHNRSTRELLGWCSFAGARSTAAE
jgi:hypothetical protein